MITCQNKGRKVSPVLIAVFVFERFQMTSCGNGYMTVSLLVLLAQALTSFLPITKQRTTSTCT